MFALLTLIALLPQAGGETHHVTDLHPLTSGDEFGRELVRFDDLDGDGIPEIGGLSWNEGVVYSSSTKQALYRFPGRFGLASLADMDGDSVGDILSWGGGSYAAQLYSGATGALIRDLPWAGGQAVSSIEDLNGDGVPDLIVGIPDYAIGYTFGLGMVRVVSGADGTLLRERVGNREYMAFGAQIAVIPDMDGDGLQDFVTTDPASPDEWSHLHRHKSYVYFVSSATLDILGQFGGYKTLGYSIALVPDRGGDGFDDLLVGAPEGAGDGMFRLYSLPAGEMIFDWGGDKWTGYAVAAAGDTDGDGTCDYAVGDPLKGINSGQARIFSGDDGRLLWRVHGGGRGLYGWSLAGNVDWDQDGLADVAVAAPFHDSSDGLVRVYGFSPWIRTDTLSVSLGAGDSWSYSIDFPSSVAGLDYQVLASMTGTGPTLVQGVMLPLTEDLCMRLSSYSYAGAVRSGLQGVLDADGNAEVQLHIAPRAWQELAGRRIYVAAVALSSARMPQLSSAALPLDFLQ